MNGRFKTLPDRFLYCRRCGTDLVGFTQAIGVCHSCVGDTNRDRPRYAQPRYSFTMGESDDADQEERTEEA